nr:MAG: putative RNA-dependent RNA polymerase [Picobirnaviridae sp.]
MQEKIHPILQEVISLMRSIQAEMTKTKLPEITEEYKSKGFESSRRGASQPTLVAMSPLMKNALEHYGDKPKEEPNDQENQERWRLKVDDPLTKAEKAIASNIKQLLFKYNGSSNVYDESKPLDSVEHYNVQCHQNFKENMRDIQPGQAKTREKLAHDYAKPTSNTIDQIIKMIETNPVFQKAILLVMNQLPEVKASSEIREINAPFMTKHSGVGAPYWKNDRSVDENTGLTYAQITMNDAEKIKDDPNEWYKFNISTMYGRNQRGKGRLLIAVSRILNLVLNQLEAVEIDAYKKKSPLFVGYRDDRELKRALTIMYEECIENGLKCANEDYTTFDYTVGQGIIVLVGAISIYKANGSRSKRIALKRAVFATHTLLLDGLSDEVLKILGRVFSGFIDTNRGGGVGNATMMTTCCMNQDPKYSDLVYLLTYYMMVMGDDNLHVYRTLDRKVLAQDMKKLFGAVINEDKYEFGLVFLQYRLFRDPTTKQLVMAYAWDRVVRSMLMKEESKGLGPVGWTYAWYQQLAKLIEYKPALYLAVNLLIVFDENKFFLDVPIKELNNRLKLEDEKAFNELKTDNQKRKFRSTWDALYDGDPSKARFREDNPSYLEEIQAAIKEVYDPHFYQKHNLAY